MDATGYIHELGNLAASLRSEASQADVRGKDVGSFVFATKGERALEMSKTSEGRGWIEFWNGIEEMPCGETWCGSVDEALQRARKWLRA